RGRPPDVRRSPGAVGAAPIPRTLRRSRALDGHDRRLRGRRRGRRDDRPRRPGPLRGAALTAVGSENAGRLAAVAFVADLVELALIAFTLLVFGRVLL